MYRDPSEFRERFKAYKDGKSVREIYGLPGYYDGKEAEEVSDDTYRFIRKHEGFAKTLTPDPGNGLMFIGSGLSGKKYIDAFKAKGVWTEVDNTRAIKEVVRQNRSYIRAIFGERYNHLTDDQKKVIDDIAFNIGVGNLTKEKAPKFVAAVLAGDDVTAKKEINWGDKLKDIYGNPLIGVLNRNIERRMLWGGRNNMPEWKAPHIISKPDVTRVATTIPQLKTIPIADPRNATIAEAERAMWAHNVMEDMKGAYQVPVWEFPSLPALTPVGYDVTPMRYKNGKLPGYYEGELPMGELRLLTDKEVKLAAQNASHEQGMSGEDPLMSMLVGMKAVRLVGDLLALRRLKLKAEMYKRWREANELTRDASRAWKMLDADKMARDWGYSDNPLGFFYDIFLDPIANIYTKIQKHPILGPLIPFSDGKLPGYSNGKIRIKPANRGKFNATKKRTGKTTEELTHSKIL